jgi:hypothetical protein
MYRKIKKKTQEPTCNTKNVKTNPKNYKTRQNVDVPK